MHQGLSILAAKEKVEKPAVDVKEDAEVENGTEVADSKAEQTGEKDQSGAVDESKPAEKSAQDGEGTKNEEPASSKDQTNKFMFQFPSPYAHELCTLRQNIIDAFVG